MTTSPSNELLELSRITIDTMLEAFPFLSEGEVETITGYELSEYEKFVPRLRLVSSFDEVTAEEMGMVYGAALSIRSLPRVDEAYYRDRIGIDYAERMEFLMDSVGQIERFRRAR